MPGLRLVGRRVHGALRDRPWDLWRYDELLPVQDGVTARLGVIGGVGPLAGAHFYRRLIELTPAQVDADHIAVVLATDPALPSRVDHLLGAGPTPLPALEGIARTLVAAGADALVIPSVTTNAYREALSELVAAPIVDPFAALADELAELGCRRPAVLATSATVACGVLDAHLAGVSLAYPDMQSREDIQNVIDAVKGGDASAAAAQRLAAAWRRPWADGSDVLLLACTELPVLTPYLRADVPLMSVTDVIARAAIRTCLGAACP